jgi:predicted O-methyltransferase YrrM
MNEDHIISKWVRLHRWNWMHDPIIPGQEWWVAIRQAALPASFLYHVLQFCTHERNSKGARFAYLPGDPVYVQLMKEFASARPPSVSHLSTRMRARYGDALIRDAVDTFLTCGFLVPTTAPEPVDCRAVYLAACAMANALQMEEEFVPTLELVAELDPEVVVEIGTAWGGTLFAWAQVAHPEAHLISVDLGPKGEGYTQEYVPRFRQFCGRGQRLTCVLGDSKSAAVQQEVRSAVGGRDVDLLFIDGDHSYEGAKNDFDTFSPLVRPGGLVVFHDARLSRITPNEQQRVRSTWGTCVSDDAPLIDTLWEEVKHDYRHVEFMHGTGIGVLWM